MGEAVVGGVVGGVVVAVVEVVALVRVLELSEPAQGVVMGGLSGGG